MSSDPYENRLEEPFPLEPPRRRGHPILAWLVIVLVAAGIVQLQMSRPMPEQADTADSLSLTLMEMQARYLVGAADLLTHGKRSPDLEKQARDLNHGPLEQRWRSIILIGELAGPEEALHQLDSLENEIATARLVLTPEQVQVHDLLERLYTDYEDRQLNAPSLDEQERARLRGRLGWLGALSLAPVGGPDPVARQTLLEPARRTVIVLVVFVLGLLALMLVGGIGLCVFFLSALTGNVRSSLADPSLHGGIYAETFALWMVLFVALSVGLAFLPDTESKMLLMGLAMLFSLTALAWPVLRGVPWRQVRQDIGLHAGRSPLLEPFLGGVCYVMALPLLVIGIFLTLILLSIQAGLTPPGPADPFAPTGYPAHPIVVQLVRPGWWSRLQILFLAVVAAPLVEETMFRGILYRHLRDASGWFGTAVSFLFSAFVVSFLFAVIHPQGVTAVPALMSLAFGLTIAREWRGSLIPSMVAHGLNNGMLLLLFLLAAG